MTEVQPRSIELGSLALSSHSAVIGSPCKRKCQWGGEWTGAAEERPRLHVHLLEHGGAEFLQVNPPLFLHAWGETINQSEMRSNRGIDDNTNLKTRHEKTTTCAFLYWGRGFLFSKIGLFPHPRARGAQWAQVPARPPVWKEADRWHALLHRQWYFVLAWRHAALLVLPAAPPRGRFKHAHARTHQQCLCN